MLDPDFPVLQFFAQTPEFYCGREHSPWSGGGGWHGSGPSRPSSPAPSAGTEQSRVVALTAPRMPSPWGVAGRCSRAPRASRGKLTCALRDLKERLAQGARKGRWHVYPHGRRGGRCKVCAWRCPGSPRVQPSGPGEDVVRGPRSQCQSPGTRTGGNSVGAATVPVGGEGVREAGCWPLGRHGCRRLVRPAGQDTSQPHGAAAGPGGTSVRSGDLGAEPGGCQVAGVFLPSVSRSPPAPGRLASAPPPSRCGGAAPRARPPATGHRCLDPASVRVRGVFIRSRRCSSPDPSFTVARMGPLSPL